MYIQYERLIHDLQKKKIGSNIGHQGGHLVHATRAFGAIRVGFLLYPEGRKRLLVRGSSFAFKKRERSFLDFQFFHNFFFENFPQFAPRGEVICDQWMLHLWIFSRLIFFFMMFTFFFVYARAFENRQISSS